MEVESYEHGVPSWVDVSSTDLPASVAFYSGLFGWTCQEGPPEAGGYRIAEIGGRTVAGLGPQMNPGAPPAWLTYVNVDSADAVAEKVTANGGVTFVPPFDVLDVGRMAVFADRQGAVFGVWQPGTHKGAGLVNEPNTLCWNELMTTDVEAAKDFYGAVFGWIAKTHGEGPGAYSEFEVSGRSIAGMMEKPPMVPAEVPPNWSVYFAVAQIDAAIARIKELGGQVMMGPMEVEVGKFAVAVDPVGAVFNVIEMKQA